METLEEWKNFVEDLKKEWKTLWRDRIDDRVRAEGIANRDYSRLFVDQGTIIVATRDYKLLDFVEILQQHKLSNVHDVAPVSPSIGGWGKFIRDVLKRQKQFTSRRRGAPPEPYRKKKQQSKNGGRGWLHLRMRQY